MKKFAASKIFALLCLLTGLITIASVIIQMFFPNLVFPESFDFGGSFGGASLLAYFTILSNIFVAFWLILFALYRLLIKKMRFVTSPIIQGGITLYILITGIVYFSILTWAMDIDIEYTVLFSIINYINHLIIPVFFCAIWFLPISNTMLKAKSALIWLIFPLLYFIFSMIRGALTDFYPYPFLDPNALSELWSFLNGYFLVGVAFIMLLGAFYGLSRLLIYLRNRFVITE